MTQLWVIQTKLTKEDACLALVDAFHKLGLNWAAFPLIPFQHSIPWIDWDGPRVYYGSTGLVDRVWKDPDLMETAALYYSPGMHAPAYYGRKLGTEWLNHGARFTTINEFFLAMDLGEMVAVAWKLDKRTIEFFDVPLDQRFFFRPDSGGKAFAGTVETISEFVEFATRALANGAFKLDQPIVINRPIKIAHEYRTWWIGGEVAAVVGYKEGHRVVPWLPIDQERDEIYQYAKAQGAKLHELEAFVLDVARLPDGTLKVVEINDVHAAGFYHPDVVLDVVAELSNYVAKYPKATP